MYKRQIVPLKHPQPTQALPLVKKDAAIANIQYMDLRQGMASYVVWSIIEDRKGNLWFGNEARGVSKYDGQFFTHFTEKEGLSNDRVVSVFEDKKGNLWFGTDRGVNKYDGASFTHFTEKNGFCNYRVESIMEDRNGNLWFGSFGGGISKYDGKSFTPVSYTHLDVYKRQATYPSARFGAMASRAMKSAPAMPARAKTCCRT